MTKTIYTEPHQEVCGLLVTAREEAGLRQIDVAEKTGILQTELSKIENGQRKVEFLTLLRLANLYQKPIDFFIPQSFKS